ncbi:MAG: tetratricopeptide repeat protein [Akkermansiaceae bacterium]
MKKFLLLSLIFSSTLYAQDNSNNEGKTVELLPSQEEYLNLPEETRKEFAEKFSEAARYFQQKRIFECLEKVNEAEKLFENSPELLNLRGSCYVEMRAFEKAMTAFDRALELNPKNTSIRFNVAEVHFVTKQWQKAHDLFQQIMKEIPESNISLGRLIEFKILLCKKKMGQNDEVIILADKYDYQDDSPYYYYAKAALAYADDELLEAEQWLGRANRIFRDPAVIAPWQDTLVEFGYIKSFYGEEEASSVTPPQ